MSFWHLPDKFHRIPSELTRPDLTLNQPAYTAGATGAGPVQAQRVMLARLADLEEKKNLAKELAGLHDEEFDN